MGGALASDGSTPGAWAARSYEYSAWVKSKSPWNDLP